MHGKDLSDSQKDERQGRPDRKGFLNKDSPSECKHSNGTGAVAKEALSASLFPSAGIAFSIRHDDCEADSTLQVFGLAGMGFRDGRGNASSASGLQGRVGGLLLAGQCLSQMFR